MEAELISQICQLRVDRGDDYALISKEVVRNMLAKPDSTKYDLMEVRSTQQNDGKVYYVDAPGDGTVQFHNTPTETDRSPEYAADGSAQAAISDTDDFIQVRETVVNHKKAGIT